MDRPVEADPDKATEQLEAIAREWDENWLPPYFPRPKHSPGATESDAIVTLGMHTALMGYLGTVVAGATMGTFIFPLVGTVVGGVFATMAGLVPVVLATLLYGLSRGRVSPQVAMALAGSAAGVCSFASLGVLPSMFTPATIAGLLGAAGGYWGAAWTVNRYEIEEGYGYRPLNSFAITDLLLMTTWLAMLMAVLQLLVRVGQWPWSVVLGWLALAVACAAVVSAASWLLRRALRTTE